ncbi:ADP-glyceromanno-heptose 6-epimerase [Roseibium aggregatum]|uniref:ADP-glyceromanno-heptose 6-epimerase n=1 Tax=Roseibium aggregatum TaxID=187304 RepID=UPI0025ABAB2D|nr:ADP-glyceromanno-heptose 6-epimerase [Roseibium aggregatum]WJS05542.1 ADP-glyceromanno-heptose 6-epimerase [Roseibium aggregatum]
MNTTAETGQSGVAMAQRPVLVTGGAGFIGSNFVASLLSAERADVIVLDQLGSDNLKWKNLAKHRVDDILPPAELENLLSGTRFSAVVHLGAISATTARDADAVIAANFRLSKRLWQHCSEAGIPLLYASSAATYGDGAQGYSDDHTSEALARLRPQNLYGWSKHLFDTWAVNQVETNKPVPPQWIGLKFFNVYGPNEAHKGNMKSVFARFYEQCAAGDEVELFRSHRAGIANGAQQRDFVYVEDCVAVMLWMLTHPTVNGIFNLGTGESCTFRAAIETLYDATGYPPKIRYVDMPKALREHYQYFTKADISRLRSIGYKAQFKSVDEGARHYVKHYLATADLHR